MPERRIEIDESAWPVLRIKTRARDIRPEDVPEYRRQMDQMLARREIFVTILDNSSLGALPNPRLLRGLQSWVDDNRAVLSEISCGTVIIAKSALTRGVAKFLLHARRLETAGEVVGSMPEAVDWARARLKERGITVDESKLALLLGHEAELSPLVLDELDLDLERLATVELTVSAFSQPAFLVDIKGNVLFENVAATHAFGQTPPWLARTIDHQNEELKDLCRIVPLDLGGPVLLVVPGESLVPSPGETRPEVELPEALLKVAELVAQGMSDKEVALHSEMSLATVRTYVSRIFRRLNVHSRGELIRIWTLAGRD